MSGRREHKKRQALRLEYKARYYKWLEAEPPKILFWRWRKWKKNRPLPYKWMKGGE